MPGWLIILMVFLAIYLYKQYQKEQKEYAPLRLPPEIIHPIEAAPEVFAVSHYNEITFEMPPTMGGPTNTSHDQKVLEDYAKRVEAVRSLAEYHASSAILKFEKDHALLKHQQLQIFRRVYQSKRLLIRFTELQGNKISATDIPEVYRVVVPPRPKYPSFSERQKQYSSEYNRIISGIGHGAGRAISTNGGLSNSNNIWIALGALAVTAATIAIKEQSNISKTKRVLEDAKGQVSNYCISLKTTVGILGKAHEELVEVSKNLKIMETRIIDLIDKVGKIPLQIRTLQDAPSDIKEYINTLYFLTLQAEVHGKNPL